MTKQINFARDSRQPLGQNKPFNFARRHALVLYRQNAIYSFIPKNACSTLRYSLGRANGLLHGPEDIGWIHNNNNSFSAELRDLARADYAFVVLRCPYARLVSVFLDKIVSQAPKFWAKLRSHLGEEISPDSLTFRDFAGAMGGPLLRADIHWRPQSDFLVYRSYDRYFAMEDFASAVATLRQDIGFEVLDARGLTSHGTDTHEKLDDRDYADTPVAELAALKRAGKVPRYGRFFDSALAADVRQAYRDDLEVYAAHCDGQHLLL